MRVASQPKLSSRVLDRSRSGSRDHSRVTRMEEPLTRHVRRSTRTVVSDFYSWWSLVAGVVGLIVCLTLSLSAWMPSARDAISVAAFANATTVGFVGAAILAYKGIELDGSPQRKFSTNFVLHALPAFVATALHIAHPIRARKRQKLFAAAGLIGLQGIYMGVASAQHGTAFDKIEGLYLTPPAVLCCTVLLVEIAIIAYL